MPCNNRPQLRRSPLPLGCHSSQIMPSKYHPHNPLNQEILGRFPRTLYKNKAICWSWWILCHERTCVSEAGIKAGTSNYVLSMTSLWLMFLVSTTPTLNKVLLNYLKTSLAYIINRYRKTANKRHIEYQNLINSRFVLHMSLSNPLLPGVKSIMKT